MPLRAEEVPDEFVRGDAFWGKVHYTTQLRVDPRGHILYWTTDLLTSAKESSKRALHPVASGLLCPYVFFDEIVDVRVTEEIKDDTTAQFSRYRYSMTVITNKDFVSPRMWPFRHLDKKIVEKWESFIMKWAYKLKKEYHGVTYYLQKLLAPHIYCCPSDTISMHTIIDVFSPKTRHSNQMLVDYVIHDSPFKDQKSAAPVLLKKAWLHENMLADIIISACKMAPKKKSQKSLQSRALSELFASICNDGILNDEGLKNFLNETQRDPRLNEEAYRKVFTGTARRLSRRYSVTSSEYLDFRGFLRYLLSDDNTELNPKRFQYDETSLTEPLSAYYINSSHNTYQIDEQIYGHADVEIYRQILLSGCRCIELDCWDGNDGIEILHGNAFCSSVPFRDVCYAIKETAFKTSNLPVLLSIENHCNKANQKRMAQIFKEILGDLLLTDALEDHPLEPWVCLPSPLKLRNKILLKGKKPSSEMRTMSRSDTSSSILSEGGEEATNGTPTVEEVSKVEEKKEKVPLATEERRATLQRGNAIIRKQSPMRLRSVTNPENPRVIKGPDLPGYMSVTRRFGLAIMAELDEEEQKESKGSVLLPKLTPIQNPIPPGEQHKLLKASLSALRNNASQLDTSQKNQIAEMHKNGLAVTDSTLSHLINYLQTMSPKEKEAAKNSKIPYDVHYKMRSESESCLDKADFNWSTGFNALNLTRIYPKGTRFSSDNYNPWKHWACGCQMVALNFQTRNPPMQLNQTLFEENGRSGYVLKPKCLRDPNVKVDYYSTRITGVIPDQLEVTVIGAFMLSSLGAGDQKALVSHVQVGLYDMPQDTTQDFCTPKGMENGLVTTYTGDTPNEFPKVVFEEVVKPEYAFLYFNIVDQKSGQTVAQRFLPVHKLQPGFRFVVLRDSANRPAGPACLLVRMKVAHFLAPAAQVMAEKFAQPLDALKAREELKDKFANPLGYSF